ncbi:TPA: hypothetical protein ROY01_006017 [Bacillus toyonensis]|nr:hypothetical protein [Bacillus toyonensis]
MTKEHKVYADVDTAGTILTTFGTVYDLFLREPFTNWLSSFDAQSGYDSGLENIGYKAPDFGDGQFAISVFDFYKNQNFSKKVKIGYPNGTIEYKTIKHGEQLIIKQAGTLIDLDPDGDGDFHYISKHLLKSNTGIALTNWQTFYLKKANQKSINLTLLFRFYANTNPVFVVSEKEKYYNDLNSTRKAMATITSQPIYKTDFIDNYEKLSTEETYDQANRIFNFSLDL